MMKRTLSRSHSSKLSGFTLVELLVVIGIIAILASVILFAGTSALRAAKQAKAQATANAIQAAALGYYTEYSVYPVPTGTVNTDYTIADAAGNQTAWGLLIDALSGNVSPYSGKAVAATTITNARAITFLSLRSSDVDNGDAPLNPVPTGPSIYFNIAMDSDYDNVLGVAPSAVTTMPNFATSTVGNVALTGGSSSAGVVVWANCNGKATLQNPSFWVHTY